MPRGTRVYPPRTGRTCPECKRKTFIKSTEEKCGWCRMVKKYGEK